MENASVLADLNVVLERPGYADTVRLEGEM